MENLTSLYEIYQNNVVMFPGMIQQLADDLNVSIDAIKALGVGFWPSKQAWIFAERNAKGEIVGLPTRYIGGGKAMVDGSSHGLAYILNPEFKGSKLRSGSLLQDFIRIHEAKVTCPICGNPDWCLVSRDDPEDPAEVICQRAAYKENAVRKVGDAGWLHIRDKDRARSSNYQGNAGPLLPSDSPYLVVEGASDVLAAYDLGFVAVGKPSNTGGLAELTKILRGKQVVIIGENDSKKNAKGVWVHPGKEGMEITFDVLCKKFCKQVSKLMPPSSVKDLRNWLNQGLTNKELLEYINTNADTKINENLLEDATPTGIAKQWIKEKHTDGIHTLLKEYDEKTWRYNGFYYEGVRKRELRNMCYNYLRDKVFMKPTKTKSGGIEYKQEKYKANKASAAFIEDALNEFIWMKHDPNIYEPFFVSSYTGDFTFDRTKDVMFLNGILDTETDELDTRSHPELFATFTIPHNYDPDATCPFWEATLGQWFDNDEESIRLLQQWMGYNLISDNELETMMFLYGISGGGKSTITNILQEMLGPNKCTQLEAKDLTYQFGSGKVVNKNAAIFSEDHAIRETDANAVLQTIKRITGNNPLSVHIKFGGCHDYAAFARLTYECDDLPRFVDDTQALARRVNMLYFGRSFKDAPNIHLKKQLAEEIPGIINWALKGLHDLRQTNKFIAPKMSEAAKEELQISTSPLLEMAEDCLCFDDIDAAVSSEQLFDLHKAWFRDNEKRKMSKARFCSKFYQTFRQSKNIDRCTLRPEDSKTQIRGFIGVSILSSAAQRYLDSPR